MFSIGMYVSCPIVKNGATVYALGKLAKYNETIDEAEVIFFDNGNKNQILGILSEKRRRYFGYELIRSSAITPSIAIWHSVPVKIICELKLREGLKTYCIQYYDKGKSYVRRASESELEIDFYYIKNNAEYEATKFLTCDAELFSTRHFLSRRKRYIDSFDDIISTLVNTRVNLYPHQIDAVVKATKEGVTRVMLADEVGLGKTIEALAILKYHMQKKKQYRCLIVVPSSLEFQWSNETIERFGIEIESFSYYKFAYHKTKTSSFIISYAEYKRYMYDLEEMHWDMLIIDEAHKILNTQYFTVLMRASRKIPNVILLSATPITHDGVEYLQLMKLLNPARYGGMKIEQFRRIMQMQSIVRDKLFDMNNDLEYYNQIDMTDAFIMNLEELNIDLSDSYLQNIISAISPESNDKGLYAVKLALEYLKKHYIIESDVIRHRRNDIEEAHIQRKLKAAVTYEMEGADLGIFESNLYDALLFLISKKINLNNKYQWIRVLEAMHSSPYALFTEYIHMDLPGEEKKECFELIKKWRTYCDKEIEQILKGETSGKTRFGKLVEILNACRESKILIFSDFKETAEKIYFIIKTLYGESNVTLFDSGLSRLEAQLAARKFQNDENCRFIICDKSGGEGRNFQKADLIIHFDMSWSPAMMEQRIGRLDRIGRDLERDVESIVIYASETIEENIFNLYNDSLRVFSRSLCGLEIIFEELQEMISDSFARDIKFGLSHAQQEIESLVSQMEESVEREIYYSSANETSFKEQNYINEVSDAFERECENEVECRAVALLNYAGIKAKADTSTGLVYVDCDDADKKMLQRNLLFEAYDSGKYSGTFRREYAVKHDSVTYFSTNHFLYQIIMNLVDRIQEGRFNAVSISDKKIRWAGFVVTWNVDFNHERLLRGGLNPQRHLYIRKYLNEQQVTNAYKLLGDNEFNENEILSMYENGEKRVIQGIENTVGYGILYDEDTWETYLRNSLKNAQDAARKLAKSWLKRTELEDYLSRLRITQEISRHTVCDCDKKRIESEKVIMAGLEDCDLQIDSILYIEL